jgi:CubicO group peptidase (beta-lactamase class C family)
MQLKFGISLLLLTLASPWAQAATVKPESVGLSEERLKRIHDTIQRHIDEKQITGAVTLVARKGKIAHLEAHGQMDAEAKKPMAADAIFRIFSMTKPVVGVAILMLMEEGKVRLNDPVSKFIPEFKALKVAVPMERSAPGGPPSFYTIPPAREINIQDLLTHVSGLGSSGNNALEIFRAPLKEGQSLKQFIPKLGATTLDFQPGTKWVYSPLAAFDTLGHVVEVASGMTLDRFLQQRLFGPLGMKETFFHPGEARWSRMVTAYTRADGIMKKATDPDFLLSKTYLSGGGGLTSTAEDYAQFGLMLANGGQWNGQRFLSPRTVELMGSVFAPASMPGRAPGRGFGLSVQVVNDPVAAGYRVSPGSFGWDGAYGTHFWVDPKEKIVGIMMIQTSNPNRQLDRDFENAVMQAVIE